MALSEAASSIMAIASARLDSSMAIVSAIWKTLQRLHLPCLPPQPLPEVPGTAQQSVCTLTVFQAKTN